MYKKFFTLFFLNILVCASLQAQDHEDTFAYVDEYGETIIIAYANALPKGMDTTFLRESLNSKHLSTPSDSLLKGKVNYLITEIIPYKKNKYQITLKLYPKTSGVYDEVRGRANEYFLMTTYRDKKLHLVNVAPLFSKVKM